MRKKTASEWLDKIRKYSDDKFKSELEGQYSDLLISASPEQLKEFMLYMGSLLDNESTFDRFVLAYGVLVRSRKYISDNNYHGGTDYGRTLYDKEIEAGDSVRLTDIKVTPDRLLTIIGSQGFESYFISSNTSFLTFDVGCIQKLIDYATQDKTPGEDDEIEKYALKAIISLAKKFTSQELRSQQDIVYKFIEDFYNEYQEGSFTSIASAYNMRSAIDEIIVNRRGPASEDYSRHQDYDTDGYDEDGNRVEEEDFEEGAPEHAKDLKFPATQYNIALKEVYELLRAAPITLRDLKSKHERLFSELVKNSEVFGSLGIKKVLDAKELKQTISKEAIKEIEENLHKRTLGVVPGKWRGGQRSVSSGRKHKEQLVLMIVMDPKHNASLDKNCWHLIRSINSINNDHPQTDNMIGWVRLEIENDTLLVDEVQSDIMGDCADLLKDKGNAETIFGDLEEEENLDSDAVLSASNKILATFKDFPHMAAITVQQFAKANGFKKIFWHTYEGGKKLKHNDPPMYMYKDIPKSHYYRTTEEKLYKLPADFYAKEARLLTLAAKQLLAGLGPQSTLDELMAEVESKPYEVCSNPNLLASDIGKVVSKIHPGDYADVRNALAGLLENPSYMLWGMQDPTHAFMLPALDLYCSSLEDRFDYNFCRISRANIELFLKEAGKLLGRSLHIDAYTEMELKDGASNGYRGMVFNSMIYCLRANDITDKRTMKILMLLAACHTVNDAGQPSNMKAELDKNKQLKELLLNSIR